MKQLKRDNLLVPGVSGERIVLRGRVFDGEGKPLNDAVVEIWQADSEGRYAEKAAENCFVGFGRALTSDSGSFQFTTIKPGRVPTPDGTFQAPHIVVTVFARGLLKQLLTRVYFPDEPSNAEDALLQLVPADRRATLIARRVAASAVESNFEWDIVLQGHNETVFFEF